MICFLNFCFSGVMDSKQHTMVFNYLCNFLYNFVYLGVLICVLAVRDVLWCHFNRMVVDTFYSNKLTN